MVSHFLVACRNKQNRNLDFLHLGPKPRFFRSVRNVPRCEGWRKNDCSGARGYRGTSPTRKCSLPSNARRTPAQAYGRVLGGGCLAECRHPPAAPELDQALKRLLRKEGVSRLPKEFSLKNFKSATDPVRHGAFYFSSELLKQITSLV